MECLARRQGGQQKQWLGDLKERTGLVIPESVSLAHDGGTYLRYAHVVTRSQWWWEGYGIVEFNVPLDTV